MTRRDRESLFLDANVVMYAAGTEHELRGPCRRALRRIVDDDVPLVTSSEVLQEILHRYFSIGRPDAAEEVFEATRALCSEVFGVEELDAVRALALLREHRGLSPRDAIHAAVAERMGVGSILSTDTDFDVLATIRRVDPRD